MSRTAKYVSSLFTYKFYTLACFIFVPLLLSAAPGKSAKNDGLTELVKTLKKIETFSGAFVQFSVDSKGRRVQESRGQLKAQRPGMFYWHTETPLEQTVYSNGEQVTVYDPDLEQATIQQTTDQAQTTPAILFSGDINEIGDLFEVELRSFDDKVFQYLLTPKSKDSLFERLRIRFDGQHLTEMRLTDALGQESTLSFIQTQVNQVFPKGTFVANLPEGTDIIRDLPFMPDDSGIPKNLTKTVTP